MQDIDHVKFGTLANEPFKHAVCIVSLGSRLMTDQYLSQVIAIARNKQWPLSLILLDTMEEANLLFLEGEAATLVEDSVIRRCKEIESIVMKYGARGGSSVCVVKYSSFFEREDFRACVTRVKGCFERNRRFRDLCLQQTYRNLHPRLSLVGVRNQRDAIVKSLVDYLIGEIALKLFLGLHYVDGVEMAPKPEMQIMERIYGGEFPECADDHIQHLKIFVVPSTEKCL